MCIDSRKMIFRRLWSKVKDDDDVRIGQTRGGRFASTSHKTFGDDFDWPSLRPAG